MFVGAEETDKVNKSELIYPVIAIWLFEGGVVLHINNEIENKHNAVSYACKSLLLCRINVRVSYDKVWGVFYGALKNNDKFHVPLKEHRYTKPGRADWIRKAYIGPFE